MKLISMTDFVLQVNQMVFDGVKSAMEGMIMCERYAKFLKQPLTLTMFIPCDEDGRILERPECELVCFKDCDQCVEKWEQYTQAKDGVLLEGAEIRYSEDYGVGLSIALLENLNYHSNGRFVVGMSIILESVEDLIKYEMILTPAAIKKIGL